MYKGRMPSDHRGRDWGDVAEAKEHQRLPSSQEELGERPGEILPESRQTAPTPFPWTSGLRGWEDIHFCPLRHLLCSTLLQRPSPTNPVRKSTYQNFSMRGDTWTNDNAPVPNTLEASEWRRGFTGERPSGDGPRNCASPRRSCFSESPNWIIPVDTQACKCRRPPEAD